MVCDRRECQAAGCVGGGVGGGWIGDQSRSAAAGSDLEFLGFAASRDAREIDRLLRRIFSHRDV